MGAAVGEWREVPGPKIKEYLERARRVFFTTTVESEIVVKRYRGPYLWDPDDNVYLDFASGIGVSSFGGGESLDHIWEALRDLKENCGTCGDIGTDWYNVPAVEAAEFIVSKFPIGVRCENRKIYFTHGGGVANEAALTLAWAHWYDLGYHAKNIIVCFEGAFHGRNGFVAKLLDPRKPQRIAGYPMPDYPVIRAPFPAASLKNPKRMLEDFMFKIPGEERRRVAAMIFEPIQGEGGIIVPDAEALRWWVNAWRNEGAIIIADDIQAGTARTGKLASYEHFSVRPDIVTVGKQFASGIPAAAMIGPVWADWRSLGRRSESFQGSPITAVAAAATLRHILEHGVVERNAELGNLLGEVLREKLGSLGCIREIRGIGLMQGVEFTDEEVRDLTLYNAERLGLRVASAGFKENPTIRLLPSFACDGDNIVRGTYIFSQAAERAMLHPSRKGKTSPPAHSVLNSRYDIYD